MEVGHHRGDGAIFGWVVSCALFFFAIDIYASYQLAGLAAVATFTLAGTAVFPPIVALSRNHLQVPLGQRVHWCICAGLLAATPLAFRFDHDFSPFAVRATGSGAPVWSLDEQAKHSKAIAEADRILKTGHIGDGSATKAMGILRSAYNGHEGEDPAAARTIQRIMPVIDDDVSPERAQAFADAIKAKWLPLVSTISADHMASVDDIYARLAQIDQVAAELAKRNQRPVNDSQEKSWRRLELALIAKQKLVLPRLRVAYADLVSQKGWEGNVSAKATGGGARELHWVGGAFASNRTIKIVEDEFEPRIKWLRFRRSSFSWIPNADGWRYDLDVPGDGDLAVWKTFSFTAVPGRKPVPIPQ